MGKQFNKGKLGFNRRNERERIMLLVAAGLAFALLLILAIILNYKSDGFASSSSEVKTDDLNDSNIGTVALLTFERPVSAGSRLDSTPLKEVFWPRAQVPTGAIFDHSEVRNQYAKVDIAADVPILRSHLTTEPIEAVLSVRSGFRAVTIEVDATQAIEGWALPGNRVDVLLTYYEDKNLTTKIIVQNARILSFGGSVESLDRMRASGTNVRSRQIGRTMTLEVTTQDALKVQTAKRLGSLSLVMRAPEDNVTSQITELNQHEVGGPINKKQSNKNCVKKGRVRMGDREYVVDCDGAIHEIIE